jgi:hypothetical protein
LVAQLLEVVVDVLFELAHGFGGEGVADGFALSCVLGAVACVEEAAANGDEGIVVLAVIPSLVRLFVPGA